MVRPQMRDLNIPILELWNQSIPLWEQHYHYNPNGDCTHHCHPSAYQVPPPPNPPPNPYPFNSPGSCKSIHDLVIHVATPNMSNETTCATHHLPNDLMFFPAQFPQTVYPKANHQQRIYPLDTLPACPYLKSIDAWLLSKEECLLSDVTA